MKKNEKTEEYQSSNHRNYGQNYNDLFSSFLKEDVHFYDFINYTRFTTEKTGDEFISTYSFKAKDNNLLITNGQVYTVTINDKKYDNNALGYSFDIKKDDKVSISYIYDKNTSKDFIYILLFHYSDYSKVIKNLKTNTNELTNIRINQNNHIISGEIDVNKKYTYLFTTIGYHKGMKVYVDGKRVKPDIIDNAVIGLDLTKGHHEIVIDYIPQGFILGIITSIIGIICTILFIRHRKKVD